MTKSCPECRNTKLSYTANALRCKCGWDGDCCDLVEIDDLASQVNEMFVRYIENDYRSGCITRYCRYCYGNLKEDSNNHCPDCVILRKDEVFEKLNRK